MAFGSRGARSAYSDLYPSIAEYCNLVLCAPLFVIPWLHWSFYISSCRVAICGCDKLHRFHHSTAEASEGCTIGPSVLTQLPGHNYVMLCHGCCRQFSELSGCLASKPDGLDLDGNTCVPTVKRYVWLYFTSLWQCFRPLSPVQYMHSTRGAR